MMNKSGKIRRKNQCERLDYLKYHDDRSCSDDPCVDMAI